MCSTNVGWSRFCVFTEIRSGKINSKLSVLDVARTVKSYCYADVVFHSVYCRHSISSLSSSFIQFIVIAEFYCQFIVKFHPRDVFVSSRESAVWY
jgi:hypothetical protein